MPVRWIVGSELLSKPSEFKRLRILREERIGAAFPEIQALYRTAVVQKELSWKVKLWIYRSMFQVYVPGPNYGHKSGVVTERKEIVDTSN